MISKNCILMYLLLFCLLFNYNTAESAEIHEQKSGAFFQSEINWQKGYVSSKGFSRVVFNDTGSPVEGVTGKKISLNRAREGVIIAAREMAIAGVVEAAKNIIVDAQSSLLDIITNDSVTQRKIADKINNYITFKEFPSGFDSSVCEARLDFDVIIESLNYSFPGDDFPVRAEIPVSTSYTSLIVDCRGQGIIPMFFPSVYSAEGLEIYGRNYIDASFTHNGGMASYCYNEDKAMTDMRAGEHPYYAVAVKSINKCPVLSEKDIRRILSSQKTINNLKKCRVIFIIDKV